MRHKGFTLIELLIVIAIIGILAAVLVPNLLQARRTAQIRAEQAYAQNVYKVANAYIAENPNASANDVSGDCKQGYSRGGYSAGAAPGTLSTCQVTFNPQTQEVSVTWSGAGSGTIGAGGNQGGGNQSGGNQGGDNQGGGNQGGGN